MFRKMVQTWFLSTIVQLLIILIIGFHFGLTELLLIYSVFVLL